MEVFRFTLLIKDETDQSRELSVCVYSGASVYSFIKNSAEKCSLHIPYFFSLSVASFMLFLFPSE